MAEPIRLKPFDIDRREYQRAVFRFGLWKAVLVFGILGAVLEGLIGWALGLSFAFGAAIGFATAAPLLIWTRWENIGKELRHPDNFSSFVRRTVEIVDGEYRVVADNGVRSVIPLNCFVRLLWLPPFYLLYMSRTYFLTLPRSAFASEGDEARFRELMQDEGLLK